MQKHKKNFLGLLGLALVVAMTVFAYFLPANGAYAEGASDSHTDVIRVTVYDQYPNIKFTGPEDGHVQADPLFNFKFDYENSTYVDVTLLYEATDEATGDVVEKQLPLKRFEPTDLDPTFGYASGSQTYDINLATCKIGIDEDVFDIPGCVATRSGGLRGPLSFTPPADDDKLVYNRYVLKIESHSPVGYAEDEIEFYYVPAYLIQTGSEDVTNDPIVEIFYDEGAAKIEVMPIDADGNDLFDEPVVIILTPDETGKYPIGSTTTTLPFTSYGLPSGNYDVRLTTYTAETVPGAVDPDTGEAGADTIEYTAVESPYRIFGVKYIQPTAPEVPDTGRFLGSLNIAKSDYVITGIIVFVAAVFVAYAIMGRKKKDYRKNYRGRAKLN